MNITQKHLKDISDIKNLMERSSKFLSLSGLSGVSAGIFAILGAIIAHFFIYTPEHKIESLFYYTGNLKISVFYILILDAVIVLILALGSAIFFSYRKAKRKNLIFWDKTTKYFLFHFSMPLLSGGIFCIILLYHGIGLLLAPATLIFYGLAIFSASKFTTSELKVLGISEIILGILAAIFYGNGLIFWTIGFGVLHIIYGIIMYKKYDK